MTTRFFLIGICLVFAGALARADEVAVFELRIGKSKQRERVVIELYEADAPVTAANFKRLVKKGYYKKMAFHRVFPGILVQTGDPLSRQKDRIKAGTGGPGYTLPAEVRRQHAAGAVAMARLPDRLNPARRSNGSQFYVALRALPDYDGQYTVFGRVIAGLEALETISRQPADTNDYPIERVEIRRTKLLPRERAGI